MTSIQLMGMKHSGKSTIGERLASETSRLFLDLDTLLEKECHPPRTAREIYKESGKNEFQRLEALASQKVSQRLLNESLVLAWGGGTVTNKGAVSYLKGSGTLVFLNEAPEILFERILKSGMPAFLSPERPWDDFQVLYRERTALMLDICDVAVDLHGAGIDLALEKVIQALHEARVTQ